MNEPVDIVAEIRSMVGGIDGRTFNDLPPETSKRWADEVERLQAEVTRLQKYEVQHLIRYGGGTFIPIQAGDSK